MQVLVTGFEAFEGAEVNPTEEVLSLLQANRPAGIDLLTAVLPVDSARLQTMWPSLLDELKPELVLMLGQATGRAGFAVEHVAINWLDFRVPDNAGLTVRDTRILADGPAAYFSTLPTRAMVEHLRATGVPAEVSYSAGTYLCNQAFYLALHWATQRSPASRVGFVHVPALPAQVCELDKPVPSMDLRVIEIGVRWLLVYLSDVEVWHESCES